MCHVTSCTDSDSMTDPRILNSSCSTSDFLSPTTISSNPVLYHSEVHEGFSSIATALVGCHEPHLQLFRRCRAVKIYNERVLLWVCDSWTEQSAAAWGAVSRERIISLSFILSETGATTRALRFVRTVADTSFLISDESSLVKHESST